MRTERMETQQGKVKQRRVLSSTLPRSPHRKIQSLGLCLARFVCLFAVKWNKGVDVFVSAFFKYRDLK